MGARLFAVVATACLWVVVASADPNPEAEKLFRDGRKLLKDGRVPEACDAFTASSKLEPSVGTFLNLGDCRARLGQTASAWAAFVEAGRLAKKLADARQTEADRRSAELEPKLSYLTIQAPPRVQIERNGTAVDPSVLGQAVPVDPGEYRIEAEATDSDPWSSVVVIKPDGDRQTVAVPALHPHPHPKAGPIYRPTPPLLTTTRKIGVGIAGGGLVAIGTSVVLAFQARSLIDQARATCPANQPCHDLAASQKSDRAVTRANIATVVGGVGVAAIAAGVALWFVGRPADTARTALVPTVTQDSVALSFGGRF